MSLSSRNDAICLATHAPARIIPETYKENNDDLLDHTASRFVTPICLTPIIVRQILQPSIISSPF